MLKYKRVHCKKFDGFLSSSSCFLPFSSGRHTETCVRQRGFPRSRHAIYRVSFRILIALHKNDVARYCRVGNDGGGRDTYNSELSLRLSLSWQIKDRVVSAAKKEREREEDLPQISPGKRVSARVCRDSNVGASSFISLPSRSTFPPSRSFVENLPLWHSLGLPIYAITNSDE